MGMPGTTMAWQGAGSCPGKSAFEEKQCGEREEEAGKAPRSAALIRNHKLSSRLRRLRGKAAPPKSQGSGRAGTDPGIAAVSLGCGSIEVSWLPSLAGAAISHQSKANN